jgi:hypothetical protein
VLLKNGNPDEMIRPAEDALPMDLEKTRKAAERAILPIKPVDAAIADQMFSWYGSRTDPGFRLPPYYLVYFLLVDLLGFRDLGRDEKIAWSVPIAFEGQIYSIEHRKMGLGLFVPNAKEHEEQAQRIVSLIHKGVKAAAPYFEWVAEQAIQKSELNVTNHSAWLYERYQYLREAFRNKTEEAEARKDERQITKTTNGMTTRTPWFGLRRQAAWMALATIDAFFSWTEHVFIHLAILNGRIITGTQVAELAKADWQDKFRQALDLADKETKVLFDPLVTIKNQLRNFVAHGAFGKNGQTFSFHSGAGAVPIVLTQRGNKHPYSVDGAIDFNHEAAIATIEKFIVHLWSGAREPARIYIQESHLPLILSMASSGAYVKAMSSADDMNELVEALSRMFDDAANMDW